MGGYVCAAFELNAILKRAFLRRSVFDAARDKPTLRQRKVHQRATPVTDNLNKRLVVIRHNPLVLSAQALTPDNYFIARF